MWFTKLNKTQLIVVAMTAKEVSDAHSLDAAVSLLSDDEHEASSRNASSCVRSSTLLNDGGESVQRNTVYFALKRLRLLDAAAADNARGGGKVSTETLDEKFKMLETCRQHTSLIFANAKKK